MNFNVCLRCNSKFYETSTDSAVSCPVCDYINVSNDRRGRNRVQLSRNCDIFVDHAKYTAKTINISVDGLAIELKSSPEFKHKGQVRVCVHDFDIEIYSSIAWVKSLDKFHMCMGLRFNNKELSIHS